MDYGNRFTVTIDMVGKVYRRDVLDFIEIINDNKNSFFQELQTPFNSFQQLSTTTNNFQVLPATTNCYQHLPLQLQPYH